jgi:hypothetical protein
MVSHCHGEGARGASAGCFGDVIRDSNLRDALFINKLLDQVQGLLCFFADSVDSLGAKLATEEGVRGDGKQSYDEGDFVRHICRYLASKGCGTGENMQFDRDKE